ncbi:MAG: hypothetical protein HQL81_16165 [Magnetococcales bacterium]|nr:hypothetical protein [Magnetococcales bacterium]
MAIRINLGPFQQVKRINWPRKNIYVPAKFISVLQDTTMLYINYTFAVGVYTPEGAWVSNFSSYDRAVVEAHSFPEDKIATRYTASYDLLVATNT